jgi:hypothetical protein
MDAGTTGSRALKSREVAQAHDVFIRAPVAPHADGFDRQQRGMHQRSCDMHGNELLSPVEAAALAKAQDPSYVYPIGIYIGMTP